MNSIEKENEKVTDFNDIKETKMNISQFKEIEKQIAKKTISEMNRNIADEEKQNACYMRVLFDGTSHINIACTGSFYGQLVCVMSAIDRMADEADIDFDDVLLNIIKVRSQANRRNNLN